MAAESGGRRPGIRADDSKWRRLGELLQLRRAGLGYRYRPAFTADRGINIRLVTDIENAHRPNTFSLPALQQIARAYGVTYESVTAVLRGEAGELVPAEPAAPPVPGPAELPEDIGAGSPAVWRFEVPIWERLVDLADRGIARPSGDQLFPGSPQDARTWDDRRLWHWSTRARVRMIAYLQYMDTRAGRQQQQEDSAVNGA